MGLIFVRKSSQPSTNSCPSLKMSKPPNVLKDVLQKMEFSDELFQNLLLSYEKRLKAVKSANGSNTDFEHVFMNIFTENSRNLYSVFLVWSVGRGAKLTQHPVYIYNVT